MLRKIFIADYDLNWRPKNIKMLYLMEGKTHTEGFRDFDPPTFILKSSDADEILHAPFYTDASASGCP